MTSLCSVLDLTMSVMSRLWVSTLTVVKFTAI